MRQRRLIRRLQKEVDTETTWPNLLLRGWTVSSQIATLQKLPETLQPHLMDRLRAERYGREYLEPLLRKDEAGGKQA